MHTYVYIYIYRERERDANASAPMRPRMQAAGGWFAVPNAPDRGCFSQPANQRISRYGAFLEHQVTNMVSFHNFKSQILKLSVSNPKSKYVAYLSVLSQISNCQGLGRKNKHEILKTDRTCAPLWQP